MTANRTLLHPVERRRQEPLLHAWFHSTGICEFANGAPGICWNSAIRAVPLHVDIRVVSLIFVILLCDCLFSDTRIVDAAEPNSRTGESAAMADAEPIEFIEYKEEGQWKHWKNDHFSMRIPENWSVVQLQLPDGQTEKWSYSVRDGEGRGVFQVLVVRGGPEWIPCFCAPLREYTYASNGPYKMWELRLKRVNALVFKVANKELRLDIHAELPYNNDADRVRYIVESARVLK